MCYLKDATIHFPSEMEYSEVVKLQSNKQTILICVDRRGRIGFLQEGNFLNWFTIGWGKSRARQEK